MSTLLSIVIPAFNEERRIRSCIQELDSFLQTRPWVREVLIVVEPSQDLTAQIAREEAAKNDRIRVIFNPIHLGKGFAVKTGVLQAQGDWILFMDADLAISLDQIDAAFQHAQKSDASLILGDRFSEARRKFLHQSRVRSLLSSFFRWAVVDRFFGKGIDTQCGFKLIRKDAAHRIFQELQLNGFLMDVELIARAKRSTIQTESFPVQWNDRGHSTLSVFMHFPKVFGEGVVAILKFAPRIEIAALIVKWATIGVGIGQLFYSMDPMAVDQMGHIASAKLFWDGTFHGFIDQYFLGYVQNLFYPPLEDFILGAFLKAAGTKWLLGYQIYLSLVWLFFIHGIDRLRRKLNTPWASVFFLFGSFLLLFNSHSVNINDQGLSVQDLLVFGLSSQLLSGIFMMAVFERILPDTASKKARTIDASLIIYTTLALLSHLVTSMVLGAVFFVLIATRPNDRKRLLISGALATGLSWFFWGPFLIYRSLIITGNVFNDPRLSPFLLFLVLTLGIGVARFQKKSFFKRVLKADLLGLSALAMIFILPSLIEPIRKSFEWKWELPAFHYYRLSQYASWIQLWVICALLDRAALTGWKRKLLGASALGLSLLFLVGKIPNPTYFWRWEKPKKLDESVLKYEVEHIPPSEGRIWAKHLNRPISFGLDSWMGIHYPSLRFIKGLYWESALDNEAIGNYLLTLEGEPHVLAGTAFVQINEFEYSCLQKLFVEDTAITRILAPSPLSLTNSDQQEPKDPRTADMTNYAIITMDNAVNAETLGYFYRPMPVFKIGLSNYRWYQVATRTPNSIAMIETLEPKVQFKAFPTKLTDRNEAFNEMIRSRCGKPGGKRELILVDSSSVEFLNRPYSTKPKQIESVNHLEKIAPGLYRIRTESSGTSRYLIKMAWTPFFKLRQAGKKEVLPLHRAWPGMIADLDANVEYELSFERTAAIWICYVTTIMTAFGWIVLATRRRRR